MILGTVRGKIIANSALILLITAAATLYTGLASSELAKSVELLFRNNLLMENMNATLDLTETGLTGYLTSRSSDSLKDYIKYSTILSDQASKLNREIRSDELLLLQRDLAGLLDSYLRDTEAAVTAKRGRDVEGYAELYASSEKGANLARFLIGRIEGMFMSESLKAFSGFNSRIPAVITSNALLVVAATLMGFMLLVRFSYALTAPLSRLAEAARAVGRGDYGSELSLPSSSDEIGTTALAFTSMRESVRRSFEEVTSKAEVEKRLMEERMRVLDMSHKLKDAELLALQTQINPHFLFNTLSAGIGLAMSEDADKTADFLENLAAFIRYALRPPSRYVSIGDEIECAERYIWLLKLRFGERYRFEIQVEEDQSILSVETPALILQPLVENAIAHGLHNYEEGGSVRVAVRMDGEEAILTVSDSGEGMEKAEVERVLREASEEESRWGGDGAGAAEAGIGLWNVIRRVKLSTEGRGRVELESEPGKGTTVIIRLPKERESR
ncbi:MAG: histidine kinase [Treponema sp.]|nr:histidine kinase [Treponema sp.]